MAGKSRSRRGRGGPGRSKRPPTNRHYPRTARLNTLLQEIVADFFERVDDDRFEMLTVTGVEVDNDMNRAQVFVTALDSVLIDPDDGNPTAQPDAEPDAALLEALADYRRAVQAKIGREARIRKTPEVAFVVDPGVRAGARIDQILASMHDHEPPVEDEEIDQVGPESEAD